MSNKLKTIIVDDDKFQLEIISNFVEKTNFLSLEGVYSDPLVALEVIANSSPDLLLLDVEMPGLTGLELVKSLSSPPKTIIITGNKDYAVEAFEIDTVDYLVKPIDNYPRFLKAVTKVKESSPTVQTSSLIGDSIYVKEDSLLISVDVKEICYFEAFGDYVKIGTSKKVYIIHSTLTKIEKRLPQEFIRVHRSFIVRLNKIQNIDQTNLQTGEKIIPISQSMRPKLMSRISTF
ncbi:MAG: LytR/AlgR family response regulator transcription factor [Ekhidna sp.]